jgi:hypothetical protein
VAVSPSAERGWARFESTPPAAVRYRDFMGRDVPGYPAQDSADVLRAGRRAVLVRYLRRGDSVFETYWSTGRGFEVMTRWGVVGHDGVRAASLCSAPPQHTSEAIGGGAKKWLIRVWPTSAGCCERICERNAVQQPSWGETRRDGWDGRSIATCAFETREATGDGDRLAHNPEVAGSNPVPATNESGLDQARRPPA